MVGDEAWVTLATNDTYAFGALVLAHSLKKVGTTRKLVILATPGITEPVKEELVRVFDLVHVVNVLDSKDSANLALLARPELGVTFTKLHCWTLTQFKKCVFLDADTLVIKNSDELFEREELSAAPDIGWPDCFNTGVFVYSPSLKTYDDLIKMAVEKGSFDGGDQGLLNTYFSDWATKDIRKHLSYLYNMAASAGYSHIAAYKQFGHDVKIVHFLGGTHKPWLIRYDVASHQVDPSCEPHLAQHVQYWWEIFATLVAPNIKPAAFLGPIVGQLTGELGAMSIDEAELTQQQLLLLDHSRRESWEQGKADYMGLGRFDNIQARIETTMTTGGAGQSIKTSTPPGEEEDKVAKK